jgi:hypothetical protein
MLLVAKDNGWTLTSLPYVCELRGQERGKGDYNTRALALAAE